MEGVSIILLLSIAANIVLGYKLLRRDWRNTGFQALSTLCLLIAAWGLATLLYLEVPGLLFARLSFFFGVLVIAQYYFFSVSYPNIVHLPRWWSVTVAGLTSLLAVFSLTPLVLASYPTVSFGPLIIFYVAYVVLLLTLATLNIIRKYRAATGALQYRLLLILLNALIGIFWGTVFNLIVPVIVRGTPYNQIGALGPCIVVAGITYTILKHRLFNLQLQAQRLLNLVMPLCTTVAVTIGAGALMLRLVPAPRLLLATSILVVAAILTYEGLRQLFTRTRVGYLLFQKTYLFHQALEAGAAAAPLFTDLDELTRHVVHTFIADGYLNALALLVVTNQTASSWYLQEAVHLDIAQIPAFHDGAHYAELVAYLRASKAPLLIDELPYQRPAVSAELQLALQPLTGGVCLPLLVAHDLAGLIVLGPKANGSAYTSEDLDVLTRISSPLAVAVLKAGLLTHLQQTTIELTRDKKNLEDSNDELQRLKHDFLTIVDHQFNTPLSIIRSAFDMIRKGDVPLTEIQQYLASMEPRVDEFSRIIAAMLEAAHFLGSTRSFQFAMLDAGGVVQNVVADLAPLSAERQAPIQFTGAVEGLRIMSDPERFTLALGQLVRNAVIYGQGHPVSVETSKLPSGGIQIAIHNAGRGFDAEESQHIGELFWRGPAVVDYLANGSGLGVYVAKRIIEASGGTLTWSSPGPGQGSTFTIELPKAAAAVTLVTMK